MTDPWPDRVKAFAGRFSVRTKIIGIVLALTTILGLGITWQVRGAMSDISESELASRGEAISKEIANQVAEPLAAADIAGIASVLDAAIDDHLDAVFATVSRPDGVVVGTATDTSELPSRPPDGAVLENQVRVGGLHTFSFPVAGDGGVVTVGMSDTRLTRTVNAVTLQLLLTTLFVGTMGIAAASVLTWLLTRPIVDLVRTTHKVSEGDLTARASVAAQDEIGALAEAFNRMVSELETSRGTITEAERARTRLLERLIGAQEDERKRIARQLHDGVGQSLSSIMFAANMIELFHASDEVNEYAVGIRKASAETLGQVRRLGRELRPSVLDDLGLTAALERYVAEFRLSHPEILTEFHSDLPERLPPAIETTMYRVTQEGMTNVARHSGARTLSVIVTKRANTVHTIIEDDGSGFSPETERRNGQSVGIHGMIERVELVGGRLDIESSQAGTTIYAEVPTLMLGERT